jgi:hypothetical protein
MTDLYRLARDVTDEILPPIRLRIGGHYLHPDDGEIVITSGYYRDPTYGRVSNFWHWIVVATGEAKHGYGDNWPDALTRAHDVREG